VTAGPVDGSRYQEAACGLLSTDADGRIVAVNRTLAGWLGRPAEELVGTAYLTDLLTAAGRIFHGTHYLPMLDLQGMVRELAFELVDVAGNRLPVLLNAVIDPAGEVQVSVMEVRERRSYETELLRARARAEEDARRASGLARMLQQTLVPPQPPEIEDLDVVTAYHPAAGEVGGDFYDVFALGEGQWAVLLGDVCGKGVEAAVVSALVRQSVRALMTAGLSPAETAADLHQLLDRDASGSFCTMVAMRLRAVDGGWHVEIANCGHPPVLRLGQGDAVTGIEHTGPLVGLLPDPSYAQTEIDLGPGEVLVLYTDGVTEARTPSGFFGVDRLGEALSSVERVPRAVVDLLLAQVASFHESGSLRDDVALLVLGVPPGVPGFPPTPGMK
jgi:sigma-B regulation protein RsbU (phosphoserine phosphatase)